MLLGLLIAYLLFYRCKNAATKLAREYHILYEFLRRKWFFDELYHYLLVKPILRVGRFFYEVCDIRIIDKVVDGIATRVVPSLSRMLQRLQTGYIFDYITVTFFGAIVLIAYILVMFDWGA
jgi:NADH-quinone oxidoreductase subunit L